MSLAFPGSRPYATSIGSAIGTVAATAKTPPVVGAGQGPGIQATGQAADNPFQNSFFFQIPQPSGGMPSGTTDTTTPATTTGIGSYIPLIIIGVIVAAIGYLAFR